MTLSGFFRLLPAAALLAIPALFSGCSRGTTQADAAATQGILVVGNKVEPATLDPQLTTSVEEQNVERALFEGLVAPHPQTLAPEPALAESWTVSEDGCCYSFHLREGLRWSDGSPLTSADVLFSWRRLLAPAMASGNAVLLSAVKGADAFNAGKAGFEAVGLAAPDALTVLVTLERRTPWFLSILTHPALAVLPQRSIEASGGAYERSNGWTRAPGLLSSGPFVMEVWESGRRIELKANPNYWDAATVRLKGLRFLPIESITVEDTAFQGGQLHVTDTVPVGRIAFLKKQKNPALRVDPYLGVYYYALNTTHPPLDNPDVRRALALAIDRRAIAVNLLGGSQRPARSFVPAVEGYQPCEGLEFNAEEARRLLSKAGYPGGNGFPRLEILYNTSENHRLIAEAVQAMWKDVLGIDVDLRNEDFKSYLGSRGKGDFDILRASWIADYPSAFSFLDLLLSGGGNNFARWANQDYDRLVEEAKNAQSPEQAQALAQKAEALILAESPVIAIYHYNTTRQLSPAVHGWDANPMDWHPWKYVFVDPPQNQKQ